MHFNDRFPKIESNDLSDWIWVSNCRDFFFLLFIYFILFCFLVCFKRIDWKFWFAKVILDISRKRERCPIVQIRIFSITRIKFSKHFFQIPQFSKFSSAWIFWHDQHAFPKLGKESLIVKGRVAIFLWICSLIIWLSLNYAQLQLAID